MTIKNSNHGLIPVPSKSDFNSTWTRITVIDLHGHITQHHGAILHFTLTVFISKLRLLCSDPWFETSFAILLFIWTDVKKPQIKQQSKEATVIYFSLNP
jgi:hypothetical protein